MELSMLIDFGVFLVLLSLLAVILFLRTISILHRVYIALHISFMVWALLQFSSQTSTLLEYRLLFAQSSYIVLALIGIGCLMFSAVITKPPSYLKSKSFIRLLIPFLCMVCFVVGNPGELFIKQYSGDALYKLTQPGPLFYVFIAGLYFYGISSLVMLFRKYYAKDTGNNIRTQTSLAIKGISIIFIFGTADAIINIFFVHLLDRYYPLMSVGLMVSGIYMIIQMNRTNVLDMINLAQREVMNSISVGILIVDVDHKIIEMNKQVSEVLTLNVGKYFDMYVLKPLLSHRDWRKVERLVVNRRRNPNKKLEFEIQISNYHILVMSAPILDYKSKILGYMYTFQNVTDIKNLMKETQSQNILLKHRNQELLQMQEQLFETNQKLHEIAITDPLTECYNRRYLMEFLEEELAVNLTEQLPFTIIILDIDHFKYINDSYGHQSGDIVLIHTVNKLNELLREIDVLARYGGEEFIIYLPHLSLMEAHTKAEQLKSKIEHNKVWIDDIQDYLSVTVSIGIVTVESYDAFKIKDSKVLMNEIMNLADQALYEAKYNGRNLIVNRSIATM